VLRGFAARVRPSVRAWPTGGTRLPDPSRRAHSAPLTPDRSDRRSTTLRTLVGALFVLSVLAVPQVVSPESVAAGSSCTGWTSTTNPPRSIKVLNRRLGKVEKVPFRTYVKRVMASGEWPSRLKMATLEAGAVFTKQYAWYYAMKGNHRSHMVHKGKCYDVIDDTSDQLYKHYVEPDARQRQAVDKTWGLSLRKQGKFFLTGYRAGHSTTCAADANGWKLYARSVDACAQKGWSYQRILKSYLKPNYGLVWSTTIGPDVTKPRLALKVGNDVAVGAATVSWKPKARGTGVQRFQVQRKIAGGKWKTVRLAKPRAPSTDAWVKLNGKSRFRVRAQDRGDNWGPWSYTPQRRVVVRGPTGITLAGNVNAATVRKAKVRTRFRGRSVAVVMRTGPGMGRVRVFVDGKSAGVINLDRPKNTPRKLVFARNWNKAGRHSIAIKPVAGPKRVDFNGFLVLR
jgi:hypothetical protein